MSELRNIINAGIMASGYIVITGGLEVGTAFLAQKLSEKIWEKIHPKSHNKINNQNIDMSNQFMFQD